MHLRLILPVIASVIVLGVSISAMPEDNAIQDAIPADDAAQREEIRDFSYFPTPTLPSANVLDNIVPADSIQNSEHAATLSNGYNLIAVDRDPFYDEITLFYATPEIQKTVANDDSVQDLVEKGVIVFDYEKIDNLEARTSNYELIFTTNNSNPVYTNSGLHGEYLTIAYLDENVLLHVYGNGSVDLRELVASMDL